jgi:ATP-dependent Lhr-like helicase
VTPQPTPPVPAVAPTGPSADAAQLSAASLADIADALTAPSKLTEQDVTSALWDLVWAGLVTNDTLAPLRSLLSGTRSPARPSHRTRPTAARSCSGRSPTRTRCTPRW